MAEWYEALPPELTVEHQGQQVALRDVPFVKESKDLPSFVKGAYDAHREVGARVPVKIERIRAEDGTFRPKQEAVDAWKKDHLPKLYEAGILTQPPATPEAYEIKRPADLPEQVPWSDEFAGEFATILHKYGIPKSAVPELLALHNKALYGFAETFNTDFEAGMKALKAEHGDKFDERMTMVQRLTPLIFKDKAEIDFFNQIGLGNHPGFLSPMLRLAHLAQQDTSFLQDVDRGGGLSGDEVRAELAKIMNDPKHEMHEGYRRNDPKVMAHIDSLYRKAYGEGKVEIGRGVEVSAKPGA